MTTTPSHFNEIHSAGDIKSAVIKAGIFSKCKDNKKIEYYNVPCAFDIETTSFYVQSTGQDREKRAIMYIWTLSINGVIIQGRNWDEFLEVCQFLESWYNLSKECRLVIYVHNLAFEFQFFHKWFQWEEVFALEKRKPVRALTIGGIEFRCSFKLSGYSLENLGKNLTKYKVEKLVGDLDYSKLRNSLTTLTEQELAYCVNDVLVVTAYIREYIERVQYIFEIPMTKTGEVRKFARNSCFYGGGKRKENYDTYRAYRHLMSLLTLSAKDYADFREAFMGGFTHANPLYSREVIKNVHSFDFTSSYPYVMVSEKFPMSSPKYIKIESNKQLNFMLSNYCCIFLLELWDVTPKLFNDNYISKSHCRKIEAYELNNGRVVECSYLCMMVTEQDYIIINSMYNFSKMRISNFKYMRKDYLPTNFVKAILELYQMKTTLKGIEGREVDYLLSKERINSMYGMIVTDICRDVIKYSPVDWTSDKPDIEEAVAKNNMSLKRFLYYPWGVWVTAYARRNLFTAIIELGDDYIYSDTDSVKFINYENHKQYFLDYNAQAIQKLKIATNTHRLPFEMTCPKNSKGVIKQLGVWDDEGTYTRFKTLGAKRYMVEKDNILTIKDKAYNHSITVSGVNKIEAIPYLEKTYGDKIFEVFDESLYIPAEHTGKLTHTYIDEEHSGYLTDYQGNTAYYYEKSAVHLEPADYTLSLDDAYIKYILGVKDEELY